MVDLYYTLYNTRIPTCLPNPELASILKPQKLASSFAAVADKEPIQPEPTEIDLETFSSKRPRSASPLDIKPLDLIDIGPTELLMSKSREPSPLLSEEIREDIIVETVDSSIKTEIVEMEKSILKEEIVDLDDNNSVTVVDTEPPAKKPKTEFYSDNSISLPGITPSNSSVTGPTGFEPGMFSKSAESLPAVPSEPSVSGKSDGSKVRNYKISSRNISFKFTFLSRKRKRRTRRSTNISISTSTTKIRIRKGIVTRIARRAKKRKIPTLCA